MLGSLKIVPLGSEVKVIGSIKVLAINTPLAASKGEKLNAQGPVARFLQ